MTMPHRKYRALERECHFQAAITDHKATREELEKMEREYKAIADWLEARQASEPATAFQRVRPQLAVLFHFANVTY
jgi:hypothetical protein